MSGMNYSYPTNTTGNWIGSLLAAYALPEQQHGPPHPTHKASSTANDTTFEHFFQQYERRISGYLWRMTGNIEETADLCQETFIQAWKEYDKLATYTNQAAWLFRVATHLALNQARRHRTSELLDSQHPAGSDPGSHFVERELVRQVLASMPPKQRAMLIMHEVYGYSCQDIGEVLGMSNNAVKMGMCRARDQFRELYLRKDQQ
jgi:RNA polymerase sigma-70 factor, ECF subfamily